ncbi:hypothetical protein ONZ45_g9810 [Pleurotus djamor]|nr:hypothetical protein ONZ45_g9810 [Pleurotus djamor]
MMFALVKVSYDTDSSDEEDTKDLMNASGTRESSATQGVHTEDWYTKSINGRPGLRASHTKARVSAINENIGDGHHRGVVPAGAPQGVLPFDFEFGKKKVKGKAGRKGGRKVQEEREAIAGAKERDIGSTTHTSKRVPTAIMEELAVKPLRFSPRLAAAAAKESGDCVDSSSKVPDPVAGASSEPSQAQPEATGCISEPTTVSTKESKRPIKPLPKRGQKAGEPLNASSATTDEATAHEKENEGPRVLQTASHRHNTRSGSMYQTQKKHGLGR